MDLNRIIKENLQWRKLYTEIVLRSLNPKEGSEQETKLKQIQEVERLRPEYIKKNDMQMEGQMWEKCCEDRGTWRHAVCRQLTGNGYATGSMEIQTTQFHKHAQTYQRVTFKTARSQH